MNQALLLELYSHPLSVSLFFCLFVFAVLGLELNLHLEPLYQSFFVMGVFEIGSFCLGWL
jgi:hypothetical protein